MTIIRRSELKEGRWRNGRGMSWEIASDPPRADADAFGWRLALARIDGDAPFSHYPGVDRIFTLAGGEGLSLNVEGRGTIILRPQAAPCRFPGDVPVDCRLAAGPCLALNLFLRRGHWQAATAILTGEAEFDSDGPLLLHVLEGEARAGTATLGQGDSMIAGGKVRVLAGSARLFAALLARG
jgi:hypothetical protein